MKMRSAKLSIALTALTVATVGCSFSDDDGGSTADTGPETTLGTVPDPEATSTAPVPTEPAAADSGDDPDTTLPSTTTMLTPSPDADLPTEAPSDVVVAPVTTLPGPLPEPSVRLLELSTFNRPVGVAADNGDSRLFVIEQTGTIVASDDESDVVVLDISAVPGATFTTGGEQGLFGLAFHPDEHMAYVNFTDGDGNTVVAEFVFDPVTYVFDAATYREVLTVEQPFANHNGGGLAFGPDGHLYIGLGDGGSANDPNRSSLDPSSRLGKVLRIDPLATPNNPFAVPADNPFVGIDGADPTIWTLGLRNPWRFSFDSLTGDLWIADVGQNQLEEIDMAPAIDGRDAGRGVSFGWSAFEAGERFNEDQSPDGHTLPIAAYSHDDGNCSVSGGVVARNSSFDELNGWYVYGDYCSGRVWALDTTSVASGPNGPVGTPRIVQIGTVPALVAIAEGPLGDIYAVSNAGPMYRLAPA
jgi:glucose/arabinose dehydrogenase